MNLNALAEKIGLEEDEYCELLELFLETGTADIDRLETAFDAGNAQQVARSAHTINGAAGNMGLMNVHKVAKRIELAAVESRLESVSVDVNTLKGLFAEIAGLNRT